MVLRLLSCTVTVSVCQLVIAEAGGRYITPPVTDTRRWSDISSPMVSWYSDWYLRHVFPFYFDIQTCLQASKREWRPSNPRLREEPTVGYVVVLHRYSQQHKIVATTNKYWQLQALISNLANCWPAKLSKLYTCLVCWAGNYYCMSYCENIQSILADEVIMMELIIGLETQLSKFL